MRSIVRLPRRATQLVVGILLYGLAIAMIVRGELGVSPWDVLTPETLQESFGLRALVIPDPVSETPLVVPLLHEGQELGSA